MTNCWELVPDHAPVTPDGMVYDGHGDVLYEGPCLSCGEDMKFDDCPESRRPCGHHCNCSWTQDECHWCGKVFGESG